MIGLNVHPIVDRILFVELATRVKFAISEQKCSHCGDKCNLLNWRERKVKEL